MLGHGIIRQSTCFEMCIIIIIITIIITCASKLLLEWTNTGEREREEKKNIRALVLTPSTNVCHCMLWGKKLLLVGALYRFVRQMYDCSIAFLIV